MKASAFLTGLVVILTLTSCKTKTYTRQELPDLQLQFGNGGGFVGTNNEYILLENGRVLEQPEGRDTLILITGLKGSSAKQLFQKASELDISNMDYEEPGNLFQFLRLKTEDGTIGQAVWDPAQGAPSTEINDLYNALMQMLDQGTAP